MENKFVIEEIKNEKWISIDYREGNEILYVDNFTKAYKFQNEQHAKAFINSKGLNLEDYRLHKIVAMAQYAGWS